VNTKFYQKKFVPLNLSYVSKVRAFAKAANCWFTAFNILLFRAKKNKVPLTTKALEKSWSATI